MNKYYHVLCWKNITSLSSVIHTRTCFLAEFEPRLLFLLMAFISIFAHGMNSNGLFA